MPTNALGDENTGAKLQWDEATSTLEQGDHYILVLLNTDSKLARQGLPVWKVLAWGVGLGIALRYLVNARDYFEPVLEQLPISGNPPKSVLVRRWKVTRHIGT